MSLCEYCDMIEILEALVHEDVEAKQNAQRQTIKYKLIVKEAMPEPRWIQPEANVKEEYSVVH